MKVYTQKEVEKIVLATLMFSGANGNQGLKPVKGNTFSEKATHIIETVSKVNTPFEALSKLRG